MASKVNTKFVAVLAGSLVLVFAGTTGTWLWLKNKSGDDNERKGDEFMKAQDYEHAELAYGKAVNKQRANIVRLEKWHGALTHLVPKTQTIYEQKYRTEFTGATRQLALLKRTDVAAHRAWLDLLDEQVTGSRFDTQSNLQVVQMVDEALANFSPPSPEGPEQVLRRYSALALVRIMSGAPEVTDEQIKRAREDLDAAIKADPKDVEIALASVEWNSAQAGRAALAKRSEAEKQFRDQARQGLRDVAARFPDHPRVQVAMLRLKLQQMLEEVGLDADGLSPEQKRDRSLLAQEKLKGMTADLDAVAAKLSAAERLLPETLGDYMTLENGMDPRSLSGRTQGVARAVLEKHPEDALMRNLLATSLGQVGKFDAGIEEYQKIIDLPTLPLSTSGLRLFAIKSSAAVSKTDLALQQWFTTTDAEQKKQVMEKVLAFRAKINEMGIKDEMPQVLFVDAKIKVTQEEWAAANKLLVRFFDAIGNERNADALLIHAQVLLNLNQPGAAMTAADKLIKLQPGNLTAYMITARALWALEQKDEAISRMELILQDNPNDEEARRILTAWQQEKDPTKITDPVLRELAQLNQGSGQGGQRDIVTPLRAMAEKYNYDPRIVSQLAQGLMESQDKAGAAEVVKKAIAAHPDDTGLKRLEKAVQAEDTGAALVQLLDDSPLSNDEKALRKYTVLRAYKHNDAASQVLKAAAAQYPKDVRLLELSFLEAIERRDLDAANQFADTAAKLDADSAEGLTYRARIFIMQERMPEAAATLQQAASRRVVSPEVWRLLARVHGRLGSEQDAERDYVEALKLRPTDRGILVEYIDYVSSYDPSHALQIATDNQTYGAGDAQYEEILTRLQGRVGDKNKAIASRQKLAEREPDNVNNLGALAGLLLDLKKFDEARPLIDKIKATKDSVAVALLEARYYADRRQMDESKKAMEDYLSRQKPADLTYEPFLAFGQFLVNHEQVDEGLAMMQRGLPYQEPKRAEVDRTIGDTLASVNRPDAAAQAYERVLAAGGDDPKNLVHLRLAEMYAKQQKFKEANEVLAKINAAADKENATAILLAADCASGAGDDRKARELLDRAVATFTEEPLVYAKRAEFLLRTPQTERDGLADFEAALRVRPGYPRALQMRAAYYLRIADLDKAVLDLIELVKANPRMTDVRDSLITDLLKRGRIEQAMQVADDAVTTHPGDITTLAKMSDLFRVAERFAEATKYSKAAWELNKDYEIAVRYLDCLLNDPAGSLAAAEAVLKTFQADIASRPALLLDRAKLAARRDPANAVGRKQIRDDLTAALSLIPPERLDQLLAWRKDVRRIMKQPADAVGYFNEAAKTTRIPDWPSYFVGDILVGSDSTVADGIKLLNGLAHGAADENVRVLAYRLIGQAYLVRQKFQEAADAWLEGLKYYPADWEMNNNLAYILVKYLDKAQEALTHAETAVKGSPTNPDALDTLGTVYLALKKFDDAQKMFESAIERAGPNITRVSPSIHRAQLFLAKGDKEACRKAIAEIETMIATLDTETASGYRTELDEMKKQIDAK